MGGRGSCFLCLLLVTLLLLTTCLLFYCVPVRLSAERLVLKAQTGPPLMSGGGISAVVGLRPGDGGGIGDTGQEVYSWPKHVEQSPSQATA